MTTILSRLIADSYDAAEAKAALSFQPSENAIRQLADAGIEVLSNFPYVSGACALMSVLWTAYIRDNTEYPIHVVAGSLFIDDQHVFGSDSTAIQTKEGDIVKCCG